MPADDPPPDPVSDQLARGERPVLQGDGEPRDPRRPQRLRRGPAHRVPQRHRDHPGHGARHEQGGKVEVPGAEGGQPGPAPPGASPQSNGLSTRTR